MKFIRQLFLMLALLCSVQVFAEPVLGRDYKTLNPPQPARSGGKIEVLEFFFYGCSHCFKLHPFLSDWEKKMPKDVELTLVPTIFNESWEPMSRTYYALESIGQHKRLHDELFNAWNVTNIDLSDEAKVTEFVGQHGVDRKKFGEAYRSFSTQSKVMRSKQMGQIYGIRGTPTVVVDGKYVISGLQPAQTIEVLNGLIDKARKERAGKH